jgi:hypothetical protein
MSYHQAHSALGVTRAQQKLLIDIPEEELLKLTTQERLDLVLRRQEVKAAESSARWGAIATAIAVAAPLAAFFGFSWAADKGKKQ